MGQKTSRTRTNSRKYVVASLTTAAILAVTRPALLAKVYADTNSYEWTKHVDQDLFNSQYAPSAVSADGTHMIVGTYEGDSGDGALSPLYVSSNHGTSWVNVAATVDAGIQNHWMAVDVTDNGHTMIAASDYGTDTSDFSTLPGKVFKSEDSGASWSNITPPDLDHYFRTAAISGDGNTVVVGVGGENTIEISHNGGASWSNQAIDSIGQVSTLSISDNGSKILAGGENWGGSVNILSISDNSGESWTDISPTLWEGSTEHVSTAMSSSGDKIAVAMFGWNGGENTAVYTSQNEGTDWSNDVAPIPDSGNQMSAVAITDDGSLLSALTYNLNSGLPEMYKSSDNGSNWATEEPGQIQDGDANYWRTLDLSANGSRAIIGGNSYPLTGYDATLDTSQTTVELADAESGKSITLTTPNGTDITCHSAVKESGLSAQDVAYSYPLGFVDFCFSGADASNQITLTFVTDLKPNQIAIRKFNPTSKQYTTLTGATITETTQGGKHALQVTYNLADNGPLDTDLDTGEVADPVGIGVADITVPNTGFGSQSSSSSSNIALATLIVSSGVLVPLTRKKLYSRTATKK